MKELLRYIRAYKKEAILAPLFKLLEASFELFVPLIMASIIDRGIDQGDMTYIWKMALVLFLLAAVGLAASLTAQYFAAKAAVGFATDLKHDLFAHIQALPFDALDQVGTSTMITRMTSDVNQVQNGVNLVLRLFLRSPFIVLGAMVMAFTIDWKGAMVFVVAIPLLTLVVFGLMFASIPLYKRVQGQLDKITGRTRDNLTGARVIRAFNKQEKEVEEFEEENQTLNDMQTFVGRISALMNPLTFLIINGAMIALIWIGALRVDAGILTQGQVFALVNYMSQILVELVKLANLIISVNKAAACGRRIQDIFEMEAGMKVEEESQLQSQDPQIVMDHVYMTYGQGGEPALEDINLQVKKGQTIGIIGGTGSGKSTLVHLLPRFYDISQGQLRIEGKSVREWDLKELRKKIAIVQQKAVLFQGSIRSNLLWGDAGADDDRLWKAL
ncbi:MAG: ABC transporter ATP-binding protein, partial [Eubacterium sp.]|nr:ABC transporter ATP-binding protein [Eubacterium sp.]